MNKRRTPAFIWISLITLLMLVVPTGSSFALAPRPPAETSESELIEQAILSAVEQEQASSLLTLLYDTRVERIQIAPSMDWASAWLVPVDPQTGHDVPAEPGLAVAVKVDGVWQAAVPSDPRWLELIQAAPAELITDDARSNLISEAETAQLALATTYSGYKLPWAPGETMALTQSTAHDRYTPSGKAHYSFDFAKPGYPSGMFNVHASRGGTVKQAVWTYENGYPGETGNYILLEDKTTTPTTYQLYLHLAQNTIPVELRVIGAPVQQGQFVGIADDTGISSGNHLHFMVHAYAYSYWGQSVDIVFSDVSINGGRPRLSVDVAYCYETDACSQTQSLYVSGNNSNTDTTPPTGSITQPAQTTTIQNNLLRLEGKANDTGSGLAAAQFKAKYNGSWRLIGSPFSASPFSLDWDICASNVPDGPVSLALEITDKAGNKTSDLPGLTQISKNYTCQPIPASCVPTANQAALFSDPDYRGECVVLNTGSYSSAAGLGVVGGNNAASVLVGENVKTALFMNDSYLGRGETFFKSDSNLSDNRIGADTLSSLQIQLKTTAPAVPRPVFPAGGAVYTSDASFSLSWEDAGGAEQFQARLLKNSVEVRNSGWQAQTFWHLQSLAAGDYTWQVKARSGSSESSWSAARTLVIQSFSPTPLNPLSLPYLDTLETLARDWSNSNYWDLTDEVNHTTGGYVSWKYDTNSTVGYDTGSPNSGYITSPPILLPAAPEAFLRFWYYYETESLQLNWDQRWVQISVENGPFGNLYQLADDPVKTWLQSPAISLGAYAGKTIKIRFFFVTLDGVLNGYKGWYLDDISVNTTPPPDCLDGTFSHLTAESLVYSASVSAAICPAGDVDYYQFQGTAGDQVGVQVDAGLIGSTLDPQLSLYDSDGTSLLGENDDQILYELTDSFLGYTLSRTGTYYVKVRSWDHPTSGGPEAFYNLRLFNDGLDPTASFIYPQSGNTLPYKPFQLVVSAQDDQSGLSHVEFFWHGPDWQSADWQELGADWDGSDGWSILFDRSSVDLDFILSFYARVYDKSGNWIGIGAYNLRTSSIYLPLIKRQ